MHLGGGERLYWEPLGVVLVSPPLYRRPRRNVPQTTPHPPNRNLTQLKNLILAGGFSVKVEIRPAGRRDLLALKRPLGDISARGAGGIHYWEPLGAVLVRSWSLLGRAWGSQGGS